MADNVKTLPPFKRWESLVQIIFDDKPIEDIFLSGVAAPDRSVACRLITEQAFARVKNGNYKAGTGIKLLDLAEEGETPGLVSGPPQVIPHTPTPPVHLNSGAGHIQRQQNTGYKPFKCPILNLCGTRMSGTIIGTTVELTEIVEEK